MDELNVNQMQTEGKTNGKCTAACKVDEYTILAYYCVNCRKYAYSENVTNAVPLLPFPDRSLI